MKRGLLSGSVEGLADGAGEAARTAYSYTVGAFNGADMGLAAWHIIEVLGQTVHQQGKQLHKRGVAQVSQGLAWLS